MPIRKIKGFLTVSLDNHFQKWEHINTRGEKKKRKLTVLIISFRKILPPALSYLCFKGRIDFSSLDFIYAFCFPLFSQYHLSKSAFRRIRFEFLMTFWQQLLQISITQWASSLAQTQRWLPISHSLSLSRAACPSLQSSPVLINSLKGNRTIRNGSEIHQERTSTKFLLIQLNSANLLEASSTDHKKG